MPNQWIEHVRAVAKANAIPYGCALAIASKSYKKNVPLKDDRFYENKTKRELRVKARALARQGERKAKAEEEKYQRQLRRQAKVAKARRPSLQSQVEAMYSGVPSVIVPPEDPRDKTTRLAKIAFRKQVKSFKKKETMAERLKRLDREKIKRSSELDLLMDDINDIRELYRLITDIGIPYNKVADVAKLTKTQKTIFNIVMKKDPISNLEKTKTTTKTIMKTIGGIIKKLSKGVKSAKIIVKKRYT